MKKDEFYTIVAYIGDMLAVIHKEVAKGSAVISVHEASDPSGGNWRVITFARNSDAEVQRGIDAIAVLRRVQKHLGGEMARYFPVLEKDVKRIVGDDE